MSIISLNKYVYSLVFSLSFLSFLTTDIFFNPLTQIFGVSSLAVRLVEILFLVLSVILFFILIKKILYSAKPLTVSHTPLTSSLKNVNDPLLIIRIFGFFCVVATHCTIHYDWILKTLDLKHKPWEFLLMGCAHSGMVIFFCLSGYLMGKAFFSKRYSPDAHGIKSFYLNRILRVAPLYYFASFICIIFSCSACPDLLNHLTDSWRTLLFLYYDGGKPGPISSLWAISVEMQYYILAPFIFILLGNLLNSKTRTYTFALIVIISGMFLKIFLSKMGAADWSTFRYFPLYANMDYFLAGFCINGLILAENIGAPKNYKRNAIIAFILCMLIYLIGSGGEYSPQVITFITGLKDSSSAYQFYIHILLAFTLILTFFCIYNIELYKIKRKSINEDKTGFINGINKNISKALQILGVLSFGLYVWHEPIFANSRIMTHQNDSILCYLFICIKALFLTFILSLITYYIIERPFEKYRM
jgi:peptidoglycan/LPS O-acetylase OafA/YrhL